MHSLFHRAFLPALFHFYLNSSFLPALPFPSKKARKARLLLNSSFLIPHSSSLIAFPAFFRFYLNFSLLIPHCPSSFFLLHSSLFPLHCPSFPIKKGAPRAPSPQFLIPHPSFFIAIKERGRHACRSRSFICDSRRREGNHLPPGKQALFLIGLALDRKQLIARIADRRPQLGLVQRLLG